VVGRRKAVTFVALGFSAVLAGCSLGLDLDGYRVAPGADAGVGPHAGAAAGGLPSDELTAGTFHAYRFARGAASFSIAADAGLAAGETAPSGESVALEPGSFTTARGGGVELAADGSFTFTPVGALGSFWGDDILEYRFAGADGSRRARLTVFPDRLPLAGLAMNGGGGFGVAGARALDGIGGQVRTFDAAGDVNGDGFEDFVFAYQGPNVSTNDLLLAEGRAAYVLFGKPDGADLSLAAPPPGAGFFVLGDGDPNTIDSFGSGASGAGDVNGDGLDDVIVSSYSRGLTVAGATPDGAAYVVFGKRDTGDVASAALLGGQGGGFVIRGSSGDVLVGFDVAGAGDVNGDGASDLVVGVPILAGAPGRAGVFVVFGKVDGAPVQLADVALGLGGFALIEDSPDEGWGGRVAGVGDVNGDGLDDVAFGAIYPDPVTGLGLGRIWVVFGRSDPAPVISLADLELDSSLGYTITGADPGDSVLEVGPAGDVDGDGIDDLLVTAPRATVEPSASGVSRLDAGPADAGVDAGAVPAAGADAPHNGVVYVVFGHVGMGENVALGAVERGSRAGFAINGPRPNAGVGNSISAGDIDADGMGDVIVSGVPTFDQSEAYVVFGSPDRSSIELGDAPPDRVFSIEGIPAELACGLTATGSDVNGDGLDDLLVSAFLYPAAPQAAGGAYVVFGWDQRGTLLDRDKALIGTAGNDVFDLPALPVVVVRGGNGVDTLRAGNATPIVDLRQRGRYRSLEVIDVRGGGPQRVLLDEAALRRIPQNHQGFAYSLARSLAVLGDAEDTLEFDMSGFRPRGGGAGRVVYGKEGVYYGLELTPEMTISVPAERR
jgi:hypothetical protein